VHNFTAIQNEYKQWLQTLGFSKSIVYGYTLNANEFFDWLQHKNITQLNLLNEQHITQYFEYLQTRKNQRNKTKTLSIAHLNKIFDAIDKLLQCLQNIGLCNILPPTNYRIKQDKQERLFKIQPFTIDEIKTLQLNIDNTFDDLHFKYKEIKTEELKLVFALYYGCGLRRTEGFNLCIKDVNFDTKTIFIKQGKNYKDRIVPMNKTVFDVLQHYIYNYRNLIKLPHQRLFTRTSYMLNFDLQYLYRATFNNTDKKITLHILRHSIATHLLQNGMSIENISKFLGHSSLESTQIYTHLI
jgi:integrase/recombinase XerD